MVNGTARMDTDSTKIYGELLKKIIVHENKVADFYLNCVPFGFRISYSTKRFNKDRRYDVSVEKFEIIE